MEAFFHECVRTASCLQLQDIDAALQVVGDLEASASASGHL
jgi:hypothetical protein